LFLGATLMMVVRAGNAFAQQPAFCDTYPQLPGVGQWQSSRVVFSGDRLTYPADAGGNRIPDFSYAGYHYGQVSLPSVAELLRLTPGPGDNTALIQQALDQVGARPPDSRGIRGALVLAPGVYEIQGTVKIDKSGVVLRGSGNGSDPTDSTILRAT